MRNLLKVSELRKWMWWFINKQPVHLQVWIAVNENDKFSSALSYAFSYSYVGGIADDNQQTFKDATDFRSAGTVAAKSFVVILPYIEGKPIPRKGQMLILYRMDGTIYARATAIWIQSYDAGTIGVSENTIYKTEVHVSLISSD